MGLVKPDKVRVTLKVRADTWKKIEAYARKTKKKSGQIIDLLAESLLP